MTLLTCGDNHNLNKIMLGIKNFKIVGQYSQYLFFAVNFKTKAKTIFFNVIAN